MVLRVLFEELLRLDFTGRRLGFFFTSIVLVSFGLYGQAPSPTLSTPASELGQMIQKIEQLMEIHYLRESKKSPFDTIQVHGSSAFITVWRALPPDPNPQKIECLGYQWLLTGRGQKMGVGAQEVFNAYPALKEITLELVDLSFELQPIDGHGQFKKIPKKKTYLLMTAEQDRLKNQKISREKLKNQKECLETGRQLISKREVKLQ